MRPILPLLFLALPLALPTAQGSVAFYDVTFDADWSATTHPAGYPAGAHFSGAVGGTHDASVSFWEPGQIASPGIEAMAELGSTGILQGEVASAVGAGSAATFVLGPVFASPNEVTFSFAAVASHPLVTIVSMIAPSPDWFVGVRGVSLIEDGRWVESLDLPLYPWDAGSDSGLTFTAENADTQPKEPITPITTGGMANGTPLGWFRLRLQSATLVYGSGVNPAGSMQVVGGTPVLGQTVTLGLADPSGTMALPSSTALLVTDDTSPFFPAGFSIRNVGLAMPGAPGEFLLGGNLVDSLSGPSWQGSVVPFALDVPNLAGLVGARFWAQGVLYDGTPRFGLTDAVELFIGP